MYPYVVIDNIKVMNTFAICVAIGVVAMFLLFLHSALKVKKLPENDVYLTIQFMVYALFFAVGFAVLLDGLFKIPENGKLVFKGGTFYGGLLGGILGFYLLYIIFRKKFTTPYLTLLNTMTPGIVIAHFFGRVGCFLGGCCFGKPTNSIIGVFYPSHSPAEELYGHTKVLPTPLIEMFALLVIFVLLMYVIKKNKLFFYFILYGVARFVIEFFRGDSRGTLFGNAISPAQIISIILIVVGLLNIIIPYFKQRKINKTSS